MHECFPFYNLFNHWTFPGNFVCLFEKLWWSLCVVFHFGDCFWCFSWWWRSFNISCSYNGSVESLSMLVTCHKIVCFHMPLKLSYSSPKTHPVFRVIDNWVHAAESFNDALWLMELPSSCHIWEIYALHEALSGTLGSQYLGAGSSDLP